MSPPPRNPLDLPAGPALRQGSGWGPLCVASAVPQRWTARQEEGKRHVSKVPRNLSLVTP